MAKSNFFSYAGFHFKLCSLELRELFAHIFESPLFADTVRKHLSGVQEFVPLYTCNRFDMCFFGEVRREDVGELFWELAVGALGTRFEQIKMKPDQLKEHILASLRFAADAEGLRLFLNVASSLDSLVLGETQILGQIKTAYAESKKRGFAHKKAALVFDHCFRVSKRIRNETELFKNVISIAHLAVEFAQKELGVLSGKNILIFGAGEMALLTAKHFVHHGVKKIFIANRTLKNAQRLCQKIDAGSPLELSHALNHIAEFDVCITAYGGDDLLLTQQYFNDYEQKRAGKDSLFIDISVPRKIENSLADLLNVKLFNIDQLGIIVEQNKEMRKGALQKAEKIITEEINSFLEKKRKREEAESLHHFNEWLNSVVQREVDRFLEQKSKSKKLMTSSVVARSVCKKVSARMRGRMES